MAKLTHKLLAETAKAMAAEIYEELARDNAFYKAYPSRAKYVAANWKHCVRDARETLAKMLAMPSVSEADKETIFEALLNDRSLPTGSVN